MRLIDFAFRMTVSTQRRDELDHRMARFGSGFHHDARVSLAVCKFRRHARPVQQSFRHTDRKDGLAMSVLV